MYDLAVDTQGSYLLSVISRCVWGMETWLVETYFAYFELLVSSMTALGLCLLRYQLGNTTSKHSVSYLRVYATAPVYMVLAFLFHPGDTWISMQILVCYTMFQEAMGLLPQLYLMRNMHEVEPLTSHYVGLIVVAMCVGIASLALGIRTASQRTQVLCADGGGHAAYIGSCVACFFIWVPALPMNLCIAPHWAILWR